MLKCATLAAEAEQNAKEKVWVAGDWRPLQGVTTMCVQMVRQ